MHNETLTKIAAIVDPAAFNTSTRAPGSLDMQMNRALGRARQIVEALHEELNPWNYDMAALTTSQMVEVAFDGSLGMCNVQVCEKTQFSDGRVEYRREGSEADLSRGWRPYAWRHIPIPPPRKP